MVETYCVDNDGDGLGGTGTEQEVCDDGNLPPNLVQDCTDAQDDCQGTIDDCGICNGANADQDCSGECFGSAVVDDCGVCDGGNASQDCAGECDGSAVVDCAGECGGDAVVDECNVCDGANADQDCTGQCFGNAVIDDCGVCDGENASQDCAGVCDGSAAFDDCGVCNGGNADQDCEGQCFGNAIVDECGECNGNGIDEGTCDCDGNVLDCAGECGGAAVEDCNGDCEGAATIDDCGICAGGNTGLITNADQDCAGVCDGEAVLDDCEVCSGGTTDHEANSDIDCNGDCFGTALLDYCLDCVGGLTELDAGYNDPDGDQVCNAGSGIVDFENPADNCPDDANPDQEDGDNDNIGTECDLCPSNYDPNRLGTDRDDDGLLDACQDSDDDGDGWIDCWSFAVGEYPNTIYRDSNDNIISSDEVIAAAVSGVDTEGNTCGDYNLAIDDAVIPERFGLSQNYPNPFNPSTTVNYDVADHGLVSINVYDLTGKLIYDLVNDFHLAGTYDVTWDAIDNNGLNVPSGIYIYQLRSGNIVHTKKMLLLR